MKTKTNMGFTLIELLVSIAIIGILAGLAIPAYFNYRNNAKLSVIASDLRTFEIGFEGYFATNGCYPPDSHNDAPNNLKNGYGTEDYLPIGAWTTPPAWGGFYNWEGPDTYLTFAGISLFGTTASASIMGKLDSMLDNGDLTSGKFRQISGRYTYIVSDIADADDACP